MILNKGQVSRRVAQRQPLSHFFETYQYGVVVAVSQLFGDFGETWHLHPASLERATSGDSVTLALFQHFFPDYLQD
jgi:hypothetical protein